MNIVLVRFAHGKRKNVQSSIHLVQKMAKGKVELETIVKRLITAIRVASKNTTSATKIAKI